MKQSNPYRFVGLNHKGQLVSGVIDAPNKTRAKVNLYKKGIQIRKISRKFYLNCRVTGQHLSLLTKQLSDLLSAQITLQEALVLLQNQTHHIALKALVGQLIEDIKSGLSLAQSFEKHPKLFNPTFCQTIRAGELSGSLIPLLKALSTHQTKQYKLKRKIRGSLNYPFAILAIACIVTLGLLHFILPQFEVLFENFNAALPKPTQYLIDTAHALKKYGLRLTLISAILCYGFRKIVHHAPLVQTLLDKVMLKVPLVKAHISAQQFQVLSIVLNAGYPLVNSIELLLSGVSNSVYKNALISVKTALKEGKSLGHSLKETGLFSKTTTELIGMSEASGRLNEMIAHIAKEQSEALYDNLESFSGLFEPILMAILGLWIGGLIFALYLPIFQFGLIIS